MLSTNPFTRCACLLVAGLLSACGSGGDTTSPISAQETIETLSPSNDDPANGSTVETGGDTVAVEGNPVDSDIVGADETVAQDENQNSDESPVTEGSESDQFVVENQGLSFGAAKLLVDLVPGGDSNPAKFHRIGDQLFFWTVDADPRFARCSSHSAHLPDSTKNISFNLATAHAETGVVAMNKKMMTLGDFAENASSACAGYNGSITQVYEQSWFTPESTAGQQQFALHFENSSLGPSQIWTTDGTEANTTVLATGNIQEQSIFVGDKVFFIDAAGLSVSNSLSGDRRKLFESASPLYYGDIKQIERSPARQASFEIKVGQNRSQVWTFDLDTDEWTKTFNIKPDDNLYSHHETLLVDGPAMISLGYNVIEHTSVFGLSSTFGDVTSFETLSDTAPSFAGNYSSSTDNSTELFYIETDYSATPPITSIWRYSDERVEMLFSMSEPDLRYVRVITGLDGRIYVVATRLVHQGSDSDTSLLLWSYDQQTEQLVKLSNDDWYAVIIDHPTYDEGYTFRFLTTPDGLIFTNLSKSSGRELWFTDGTPQGSRQLADINPGIGDSDPLDFYYSGDAIYFSANDGTHGREPWMIPISR